MLNSVKDTFAILYLAKLLGSMQSSEKQTQLISKSDYKSTQGSKTTR